MKHIMKRKLQLLSIATVLTAVMAFDVTPGNFKAVNAGNASHYVSSTANPFLSTGVGAQLDLCVIDRYNNKPFTEPGSNRSDWGMIGAAISESGLDRIRIRIYPEMYERENDDGNVYTWNTTNGNVQMESIEMQQLYQVLDVMQANNVTVELSWYGCRTTFVSEDMQIRGVNDQGHSWMGGDYATNPYKTWMVYPDQALVSTDVKEEYAESVSHCLDYVINTKGYTCVKEYSLFPEINLLRSRYSDYERCPASLYNDIVDKIQLRLEPMNLSNKLILNGCGINDESDSSMSTFTSYFDATKDNLDRASSSVYRGRNNSNSWYYNYAKKYVDYAKNNANIGWSVSEFGFDGVKNETYGLFNDEANPECYDYALAVAKGFVNFSNAGCTGMNYFIFNDTIYDNIPNSVGLIRNKKNYITKTNTSAGYSPASSIDYQAKPVWYAWSLFSKFTDVGSTIYPICTNDSLSMVAYKLPNGKWSYFAINNSNESQHVVLGNEHLTAEDTDFDFYWMNGSSCPTGANATIKTLEKQGVLTKDADGNVTFDVPAKGFCCVTNKRFNYVTNDKTYTDNSNKWLHLENASFSGNTIVSTSNEFRYTTNAIKNARHFDFTVTQSLTDISQQLDFRREYISVSNAGLAGITDMSHSDPDTKSSISLSWGWSDYPFHITERDADGNLIASKSLGSTNNATTIKPSGHPLEPIDSLDYVIKYYACNTCINKFNVVIDIEPQTADRLMVYNFTIKGTNGSDDWDFEYSFSYTSENYYLPSNANFTYFRKVGTGYPGVLTSEKKIVTSLTAGGLVEGTKTDPSYIKLPKAVDPCIYIAGFAQPLVEAGTCSGGTIYYNLDGGAWSSSLPKATDIGSYTVGYYIKGDGAHNDTSPQYINVKITKSQSTFVAPTGKGTVIYTGAPIELINAGSTTTGTMKYSLDAGDTKTWSESIPTGTATGSYTIFYKVFGDATHEDSPIGNVITIIDFATAVVTTAPVAKTDLKYTGSKQALVTAGSCDVGSVVYNIDGGEFSATIPEATNVGTYQIGYKAAGDATHYASEVKYISVTISKNDPSVTAPTGKENLTYTGSPLVLINPGSTVGGTLKYSLDQVNYSTDIPQGTSVGSYTIYYKAFGDEHYNDSSVGSLVVNISSGGSSYTTVPSGILNLKYKGTDLTLVNAGATDKGDIYYNVNDGAWTQILPTGKNAGTYKIGYYIKGAAGYSDSEKEYFNVTISKADPIVGAPTAKTDLVYTGSGLTLINAGSTNGGSIKYSLDNITYSDSLPTGVNAANYTIYYKVVGNDNYNDVAFDSIEATIGKAYATYKTLPTAIDNLKYTGSSLTLINGGSSDFGTIVYSLDGSSYSSELPAGIADGQYTIYYYIQASNTNYKDSEVATLTATIWTQEVQTYHAYVTPYEGTQVDIEFTIDNKDEKLLEIKALMHTNTKQYLYSNNIPSSLQGQNYTITETRALQKYDVVFMNEDAIYVSSNLDYGTQITKPGTNPEKSSTVDKTFAFIGWYDAPVGGSVVTEFGNVTDNVTYYARYSDSARIYTITFISESATYETFNIAYGSVVILPSVNPEKTATASSTFAFIGWYTQTNGGNKVDTTDVVLGEANYYARFKETVRTYTIKFVDQGNTYLSNTLGYGSVISKPANDPVKVNNAQYNYVFDGWYDAPTGGNKAIYFGQVSGDATYYAQYISTVRQYVVTFISQGETYESSTLDYGTQIVAPSVNPTKTGDAQYTYVFIGWYDAEVGGNLIVTFPLINQNENYYAHFSANVNKYTVKFMNGDDIYDSYELDYGSQIVPPSVNPTKQGTETTSYIFLGWYDAASSGSKVSYYGLVTNNVNFYAYYSDSETKLTVKFIVQGIEVYTEQVFKGETVSAHEGPSIESTKQYDYSFKHWSLLGQEDVPYNFDTSIQTNTQLVAVYNISAKTYLVTFINGTDIVDGHLYTYGSSIVVPSDPSKEPTSKFIFDGWYTESTGGNKISVFPVVTKTVTYYARFNENKSIYTVKFISDNVVVSSQELSVGTQIVAPGNNPTKQSTAQYAYTFDAWYDAPQGGNKMDTYPTVTCDVSYYAQFNVALNEFTIEFINDGKVFSTAKYSYGSKIVKPSNTPSREGTDDYTYTFNGWYTSENGGVSTTSFPVATSNAKYYAQYRTEYVTYTVEFKTNTEAKMDPQVVRSGECIIMPEQPTREGYIFRGWFYGNVEYDFDNPVTGDMTLYAKWKKPVPTMTILIVVSSASCALCLGFATYFVINKKKTIRRTK